MPLWVWFLAMLGFRSILAPAYRRSDPEWQEKRRRFKEKIKDAFSVWRERDEDDTTIPPEDGSTPS